MNIEVHGFRNEGPIYSIKHYRQGRRFRRNRWAISHVGERGGRNIERAEHQFVHHGGIDYIIFNKGFEYIMEMVIDDHLELSAHVDALDDYQVYEIRPGGGIEVVEVREFIEVQENADTPVDPETAPDAGDDEDAKREVTSDEEE